MTRAEALDLVFAERARQDRLHPNRAQYKNLAPHILILEQKSLKLRVAWYADDDTKKQLVELAAIALRALEETEFFL